MASAVELMEQAMEQAPNVEQVASTLLETDGVAGVMATIAAGKIHDGDHHLLLTCYTALFVDGLGEEPRDDEAVLSLRDQLLELRHHPRWRRRHGCPRGRLVHTTQRKVPRGEITRTSCPRARALLYYPYCTVCTGVCTLSATILQFYFDSRLSDLLDNR